MSLKSVQAVSPWLHRFAFLTAAATFFLLGAGGLVTSHGVGMAVPDWPNTYGYNLFFFPVSRWVGGVFYEHTHRLLASGVGLLTTILAVWLYGRRARRFLRWSGVALLGLAVATLAAAPVRRPDALVLALTGLAAFAAGWCSLDFDSAPRWLRRLGLIAFVAVVLQGVLGGLRVVLFKDQIGIFHATLAQLFFALTCALALFTSARWQRLVAAAKAGGWVAASGRVRFWFGLATTLVLAQLVLGATMRHQHAGLAIPDFPLAYGKLWPGLDAAAVAHYNEQRIEVVDMNPITAGQIVLQMVHRFTALLILGSVAFCAWLGRQEFGRGALASRLTLVWLGLVAGQALLGAATIWTNKAADIATAHVLAGALTLALGVLLNLLCRVEPAVRRAGAVASAGQAASVAVTCPPHPAPAS